MNIFQVYFDYYEEQGFVVDRMDDFVVQEFNHVFFDRIVLGINLKGSGGGGGDFSVESFLKEENLDRGDGECSFYEMSRIINVSNNEEITNSFFGIFNYGSYNGSGCGYGLETSGLANGNGCGSGYGLDFFDEYLDSLFESYYYYDCVDYRYNI